MCGPFGYPPFTLPACPTAYLSWGAVEAPQQVQLVLRHGLVELVEGVRLDEAAEVAEAAVARKAVVTTLLDRVRQQIQVQHWTQIRC